MQYIFTHSSKCCFIWIHIHAYTIAYKHEYGKRVLQQTYIYMFIYVSDVFKL